jgi:hypothetical protein
VYHTPLIKKKVEEVPVKDEHHKDTL